MALRIGAFLLASYNFVSASLIDGYHSKGYAVSRGDRPEPTPSLGVGVKTYAVGAKNCQGGPDCKVVAKKYVVKEADCHGEVACIKKRYMHSHGDGHAHEDHAHGHVADHVHAADHAHVADHVHGYDHGHYDHGYEHGHIGGSSPNIHSHSSYGHRPNVNSEFADFDPIGDVDRDDKEFAKSHNTVVHVPLISSVGDTKHKVSKNYNKDRSNLPEYRYNHNYRAKTSLLEYDNILKTAVRPVKEVSVDLKKQAPGEIKRSKSPLRYKVVVPGRLEKKTFKQVVAGERRENANPVVTNYVAAGPAPVVHLGGGPSSSHYHKSTGPVVPEVPEHSHEHSHEHAHDDSHYHADGSYVDYYRQYLGHSYDLYAVHYDHGHGHGHGSEHKAKAKRSHSHGKPTIVRDPEFVEAVAKSYGINKEAEVVHKSYSKGHYSH